MCKLQQRKRNWKTTHLCSKDFRSFHEPSSRSSKAFRAFEFLLFYSCYWDYTLTFLRYELFSFWEWEKRVKFLIEKVVVCFDVQFITRTDYSDHFFQKLNIKSSQRKRYKMKSNDVSWTILWWINSNFKTWEAQILWNVKIFLLAKFHKLLLVLLNKSMLLVSFMVLSFCYLVWGFIH